MRRASSASATWRASRSASEYTATVRTPISRAVAITRQAISPRFAIRILPNMSAPGRKPRWLPLLEERGDALAAFGRDADLGDAARGGVDQRLAHQAAARHPGDEILDLAVGLGPALSELLDGLGNGLVELFDGSEEAQEAETKSFFRPESFAGMEIASRCALADGAYDIRADGRGRQAELHFGERELGGARPDGDVAGRHQSHAAGKRWAMHARHRGLR